MNAQVSASANQIKSEENQIASASHAANSNDTQSNASVSANQAALDFISDVPAARNYVGQINQILQQLKNLKTDLTTDLSHRNGEDNSPYQVDRDQLVKDSSAAVSYLAAGNVKSAAETDLKIYYRNKSIGQVADDLFSKTYEGKAVFDEAKACLTNAQNVQQNLNELIQIAINDSTD